MNPIRLSLFALGLAAATPAFAHAYLDHASPAVGATIRHSPKQLRLWFSEALDKAHSTAQVFDQAGKDLGRPQTSNDRTVLVITLPTLPAGRYRVVWRVRSADGHP